MAIDFMVMPLSRYLAGDFVTPVMQWSWDNGTPYSIIGPDGARTLPVGVPYGGPDAVEKRRGVLPMLLDDLSAMPIDDGAWDEASNAEPCFHRVDPGAYGALLEYAESV